MRRHWLCVQCEGRCSTLSSNVPHTEQIVSISAFQATGRQQLGCIIPHAVKHSLALLRMGKKLPETCWADWNINKLLLLHLVGLLHYLYQWCIVKQTSNDHIAFTYMVRYHGQLKPKDEGMAQHPRRLSSSWYALHLWNCCVLVLSSATVTD